MFISIILYNSLSLRLQYFHHGCIKFSSYGFSGCTNSTYFAKENIYKIDEKLPNHFTGASYVTKTNCQKPPTRPRTYNTASTFNSNGTEGLEYIRYLSSPKKSGAQSNIMMNMVCGTLKSLRKCFSSILVGSWTLIFWETTTKFLCEKITLGTNLLWTFCFGYLLKYNLKCNLSLSESVLLFASTRYMQVKFIFLFFVCF